MPSANCMGLGIFFLPPSCEEIVTRTGRWLHAHTDPVGLRQLSDPTAWKSLGLVGHQYTTSVELPEWSPGASMDPTSVSKGLLTPVLASPGLAMDLLVSPGGCAGL